jgi:2-oxoglutarate ferredoxin oxidoreductase subunit alpha
MLGWAVMAEVPLVIVDVQRGGPATGLPTKTEQSDLNIALYGSHGDAPRIVLAPSSVEDCFYTAIEAVKLAREYSCPVIILSDQALSSRVETWDMPDLEKLAQDISPSFKAQGPDFKPYRDNPEGIARHAAPGTPMADGKYPIDSGLEHDDFGHPAGHPDAHTKMVAKRRRKIQLLATRLPKAAVYGEAKGEVLLVGWGSTCGPIYEAVNRAGAAGQSISALNLRYLMPLQPGIEEILKKFKHVFVVEVNDEGLYGHSQLATLLRSQFCLAGIGSISKTEGLSFKVREILGRLKDKLHEDKPSA